MLHISLLVTKLLYDMFQLVFKQNYVPTCLLVSGIIAGLRQSLLQSFLRISMQVPFVNQDLRYAHCLCMGACTLASEYSLTF